MSMTYVHNMGVQCSKKKKTLGVPNVRINNLLIYYSNKLSNGQLYLSKRWEIIISKCLTLQIIFKVFPWAEQAYAEM